MASMTMDVIQSIPNLDWLSVWVKAYAFIHAGDNQRAINTIWSAAAAHRKLPDWSVSVSVFVCDVSPSLRLFSALWRKSPCCGTTWTSW